MQISAWKTHSDTHIHTPNGGPISGLQKVLSPAIQDRVICPHNRENADPAVHRIGRFSQK